MTSIKKLVILIILLFFVFSCSTSKLNLDVPEEISNKAIKTGVKGVKGKGIPGSMRILKFDKFYKGKLKEGWNKTTDIYSETPGGLFSKEANRRMLYSNLGIEINDINSKTSDTFQFSISDSTSSIIAICKQEYMGKSINYNINNRFDFSQATSQKSNFLVSLIENKEAQEVNWILNIKYDRDTPNGIIRTTLKDGMAVDQGFLANGKDSLNISSIFIKRITKHNSKADFKPFKIIGGYEFKIGKKTIGIVDLFNKNIWILDKKNTFNQIMVAGATALLLRNR